MIHETVSIVTGLLASYEEHCRCGELEGEGDERVVSMECSRGVIFNRFVLLKSHNLV